MKQKYVILRSENNTELTIKEYAELDKDVMSLLCEETYDNNRIEAAMKNGKEALIATLRTPNMYPAKVCAEKIAESIMTFQETAHPEAVEVFFDDFEFITASRKKSVEVEAIEDEPSDIEELLDDEFEDEYEEKPSIDNINSSISVEEDDLTDFDEDS